MYDAPRNASASVLSPPSRRKNFKMANADSLGMLGRISKGFHIQYLLHLLVIFSLWCAFSAEVDDLTLCAYSRRSTHISFLVFLTLLFQSYPFWTLTNQLSHLPLLWVPGYLYLCSPLFPHKVNDEVHHLSLFIRGISPYHCLEIPWVGLSVQKRSIFSLYQHS